VCLRERERECVWVRERKRDCYSRQRRICRRNITHLIVIILLNLNSNEGKTPIS
jgi:hypothetical protein